jgi:hypothetical protein
VKYEQGFYIPEDDILHSDRREHLKAYMLFVAWLQMLTGAAVCSFGFLGIIGIVPKFWGQSQGRRLKVTAVGATLLVTFLSYSAVAVVVCLMVQFQ